MDMSLPGGRYEAALVEAAQHGDREAFDRLVAPHLARLKRLLRTMLKSEADIEDTLQETLLDAWRGLGGFRGAAAFYTWLHRIARNAALRLIERTASRPPSVSAIDAEHDDARDEIPDLSAPDRVLEAREWLESFTERLEALPEPMRQALELCVIEGQGYAEAARTCGIPVGTVRSRLHRARSELGLLG